MDFFLKGVILVICTLNFIGTSQAFNYQESCIIVPHPIAKHQVRGNINLYNHIVETQSGEYTFQRFFYLEKDGEMIKITKRKFKKTIKKLVASHPELQEKIGKRGYRYKSMARIIKEFNSYNYAVTLKRTEQKNRVITTE